MSSDEELVARSMGGDLDSFNQLVLRWERPIYALAYRVIGREEDARDVAQETFLRAFRALNGFKGQAKFSSWLYRITLNLCRDWIRKERRTPVSQAPEGIDIIELAGEATPTDTIEQLVGRNQLSRAVSKAMASLPDEQRTAIILKEYHGLTFQEIADMLDLSVSAVETLLFRARRALRGPLRPHRVGEVEALQLPHRREPEPRKLPPAVHPPADVLLPREARGDRGEPARRRDPRRLGDDLRCNGPARPIRAGGGRWGRHV